MKLRHPSRRRSRSGFLLLEILLATAIFVVGIIALGRCMNNCLNAQAIRTQEDRARLALENSMAEIQANPALPDESKRTVLKGMFAGMTLIEHRRTLDVKNQDNVSLPNLHEVSLTAEWTAPGGARQSRALAFTLLRGG